MMEKNFCLAILVFTHVCVFIQSAAGLPLLVEEVSVERPPLAAIDYMQKIYQSKSDELRNGAKAATPNVWCFVPLTEGVFFSAVVATHFILSAYVCHTIPS